MHCQNCGHFLKCPGCEGFVCPACGSDLLESVQFDPVQGVVTLVIEGDAPLAQA